MKILLFISLLVSVETHFCDVCECIFDSDTVICEKSSLDFNNLQGRGPVSDYEYKTLIYKPDVCDWSTRTDTILIDPKRYFHGLNKFVTSCCEKMGLNPEIVECITKEAAAAEKLKVVPKIAIGVGNLFVNFGDTNDTREKTPENTLLKDQRTVIEMNNPKIPDSFEKILDSFEKTVNSGFIFEDHDNITLLTDHKNVEIVKVEILVLEKNYSLTNVTTSFEKTVNSGFIFEDHDNITLLTDHKNVEIVKVEILVLEKNHSLTNVTAINSNKRNIIIAVSGFSIIFLIILLFFLFLFLNLKCSKQKLFNTLLLYARAFYFVLITWLSRIFGLPVNRTALADLLNRMFVNNNNSGISV